MYCLRGMVVSEYDLCSQFDSVRTKEKHGLSSRSVSPTDDGR